MLTSHTYSHPIAQSTMHMHWTWTMRILLVPEVPLHCIENSSGSATATSSFMVGAEIKVNSIELTRKQGRINSISIFICTIPLRGVWFFACAQWENLIRCRHGMSSLQSVGIRKCISQMTKFAAHLSSTSCFRMAKQRIHIKKSIDSLSRPFHYVMWCGGVFESDIFLLWCDHRHHHHLLHDSFDRLPRYR